MKQINNRQKKVVVPRGKNKLTSLMVLRQKKNKKVLKYFDNLKNFIDLKKHNKGSSL